MTNVRAPLSFAMAMTRITGVISWEEAAAIVNRSDRILRYWSEPNNSKRPTVEQALKLDAAYRAAGGEGAPFLDTFAFLLDVQLANASACRAALAGELADAAREFGDVLATGITATLPGATERDIHRALAEAEEAQSAAGRVMRRLKSFFPFGVGAGAGNTGGSQ